MWMVDGKLDSMWDIASAMLSQVANMKAWVFGSEKKMFTAEDWNPRLVKAKKHRQQAAEVPKEIRDAAWAAMAKGLRK
jgi:hypothetical protein